MLWLKNLGYGSNKGNWKIRSTWTNLWSFCYPQFFHLPVVHTVYSWYTMPNFLCSWLTVCAHGFSLHNQGSDTGQLFGVAEATNVWDEIAPIFMQGIGDAPSGKINPKKYPQSTMDFTFHFGHYSAFVISHSIKVKVSAPTCAPQSPPTLLLPVIAAHMAIWSIRIFTRRSCQIKSWLCCQRKLRL